MTLIDLPEVGEATLRQFERVTLVLRLLCNDGDQRLAAHHLGKQRDAAFLAHHGFRQRYRFQICFGLAHDLVLMQVAGDRVVQTDDRIPDMALHAVFPLLLRRVQIHLRIGSRYGKTEHGTDAHCLDLCRRQPARTVMIVRNVAVVRRVVGIPFRVVIAGFAAPQDDQLARFLQGGHAGFG